MAQKLGLEGGYRKFDHWQLCLDRGLFSTDGLHLGVCSSGLLGLSLA